MITTSKTQLLATKILTPRCAPSLIARPRLLDLITRVETKQVAVIKAGPGLGKTTLAVAWAEQLQRSGKSIAWLALDDDDDEPTRFLSYASHALRRATDCVGGSAIDLISDFSLVPFNTIVSTWINDLADIDDDVFLFLDDYHRITDHEINDAISYLLRYAPTQFHLVLTATGEPTLPLGRLRAHNQLVEIDGSALRFDLDETCRFLEHENISGLDPPAIRLLHAKTEGWPAVLRIAAATLSQPGQDADGYIRGLSGTLRPIGAYLAEMLDGLPRHLVEFMLRIAILDRFSAPLCHAVTGQRSSRQLLDSMEAHQLLLTPLDEDGRWYRYHTLLGGYLRQRLEAELGDEILKLHRRAYRWYASQQLWTEAVRHAIAAGDADEAMSWVEQCAMELVKKGDLQTLLSWQRLFPTELERSQIKVGLAIAWGLALAMRFEDALALLVKIEREIPSGDPHDANATTCECEAIRSVVTALRDDSQGALPIAEACVGKSTDPWTSNVASNVALFGYWKAGDLGSFYATPWLPYSDDEDRRNVFASVYRRCLQGLVEFQQLRLGEAERLYGDALQLAERHAGPNTAAAALPASLLARIRYEQGRVDEAEAMVIDRGPIIDATGMLECVLSAYLVLVDITGHRRNIERASVLLERLENLGHMRKWGRAVAVALVIRVRLYLAEGRIVEAKACLNRLERIEADYPAPEQCAWSDLRTYRLLGQAFLCSVENRVQDAIAILRALRQEAETSHNHYRALRFATMLSGALLTADETAEAKQVFCEVLRAAAISGLYQSILDEGPEVGTLLLDFQDSARRTGVSNDLLPYAGKLIAGWCELYQPRVAANVSSDIVESLSPRERNILERIGQGRSNKEIARELGIAPETVKSHIKNIFVKLGVDRRANAVSRAQSLGLVRV
jgi:LuxR family transcriptional regulator, maltose regulon positive regulatory protein